MLIDREKMLVLPFRKTRRRAGLRADLSGLIDFNLQGIFESAESLYQ